MKTDLATSISAAIIGVLIAYFLSNWMFVHPIEEVTIKVIGSEVNTELVNPDPEIFNYKALNPTVEVFVGDCAEYNEFGECVERITEEDLAEINPEVPNITPETPTDNQTNNEADNGTTN